MKAAKSDHQAEVLALNEPVLATMPARRRGVGHQHEVLAESALRLISILAVSDVAANHHKNRHVLHSHLGGWLDACGRRGGVGAVDDLAIEGLGFVVGGGHLVDEDVLDGGTICNWVAVEQNRDWCRQVEGRDSVAILFEGRVEGIDKFGGGCNRQLVSTVNG